jgi:hypothetical protein
MLKRTVLALLLCGPALADPQTATLNGHTLKLSGQSGNFTLLLDGKPILHDTTDQNITLAGIYSSGPNGTAFSFASGGASSASSSSSSTGTGPSFGAALLEEDSGNAACPVKYQAVILGAATLISKPFGACGSATLVSQSNGAMVVVTQAPAGQTTETDTISATGVSTQNSA